MAILTEPVVEQPQTKSRSPSQRVNPLVWILAAGLMVRVALWFYWADLPPRIADEQSYDQLARGLAERGQYVDENGQPTSLRPPLYPGFLAAVYLLFGIENHAPVRAVQLLLSLVTVLLVYRLGCIAWSKRVGLLAAGALCFYPSLLGYNNLLLSEVLFTFFVVVATWLTVESLQRQSLKYLAAVGLAMGLGALTRSILCPWAPLLSLFLLIVWGGSWPKRALAASLPLIVFALTIAPWAIRNSQLQKTFTLVDVMGGRNAMMGNYEHTPLERSWATIDLVQGENAWHRVLARETPGYSGLTQGQIDKLAMKHAVQFIVRNPLLTIERDLVRFFNFWQLERTLIAGAVQGFFGDLPKTVIVAGALLICGCYAGAVFLGLFGALMTPPADWRIHWLLLLSIAFPCLIHSLIFAHSRYHVPVIPLVLLYAAAALVQWPSLWQQRDKLAFRIAAFACGILVLAWARELIFVDLAKASQLVG
jgi:4-amino-4-deoxy-L-arabinose transferase-like glycosyltransferase